MRYSTEEIGTQFLHFAFVAKLFLTLDFCGKSAGENRYGYHNQCRNGIFFYCEIKFVNGKSKSKVECQDADKCGHESVNVAVGQKRNKKNGKDKYGGNEAGGFEKKFDAQRGKKSQD